MARRQGSYMRREEQLQATIDDLQVCRVVRTGAARRILLPLSCRAWFWRKHGRGLGV